jgi:hypothetical protein
VSNDKRIITELLKVWKQTVMAYIKLHSPGICLEGLEEFMESLGHEGW